MEKHQDKLRLATIVLFCLLNIGFGIYSAHMPLMVSGALGMVYAAVAMTTNLANVPRSNGAALPAAIPNTAAARLPVSTAMNSFVGGILDQSRYALLLRKQMLGVLTEEHRAKALSALRDEMDLISGGDVLLGKEGHSKEDRDRRDEFKASTGRPIYVAPVFIDRYAVTNRQYRSFVAAGGYEEKQLWDSRIWPAVRELVDETGRPGPRFWRDGCHAPSEEELPVVGISWYEAQACARWMGKRLPNDAEWVKAACSATTTASDTIVQQRYPWGGSMDKSRANLWGCGSKGVVSVREFTAGASAGGVYQLIGNVWEWTNSTFCLLQLKGNPIIAPLKGIRGGAFDTYFDHQATCQFESGEYPMSRRHNIGFRCVIGLRDLALDLPEPEATNIKDEVCPDLMVKCA